MFRSNIGPGRIRLFSVIAAVTLSLFIISCQGTVSVPGSVDFGNADSPVRIELFTDYQCPVCTRFHDEVESALIRELVDNRGFLFRVTPVALLGEESALAGAYAWRPGIRADSKSTLPSSMEPRQRLTAVITRKRISGSSPRVSALIPPGWNPRWSATDTLRLSPAIPPSPGTWGSADLRASQSSTLWMSSAGMS
jgi:hypothetical protein